MNALALTPQDWTTLTQMAEVLFRSGMLPTTIKSPQAAIAIILLGRELDIAPWQSISTINVILGKPTVSPQLMLALIRRAGVMESFECKVSDTAVTCVMKRRGEEPHTETFSMDDARKMELAGKDNWKKQPKVMMKWRAVAAACRVVFPDVILGLYTPEEMGAEVTTDDSGAMVVVSNPPAASLPATTPPQTQQQPPPEDDAGALDWTKDEGAWDRFARWAEMKYKIEDDALTTALNTAPNWKTDKRIALAAVIACHCKYDKACIEAETDAGGYQIETYDAAIALARAATKAKSEAAPEPVSN